jgi:hypothetical protein
MKICWDNLEKIRYSKRSGNLKVDRQVYMEFDACIECGEPYLGRRDNKGYCSGECLKKSKIYIHHINYNKKDCGPMNLIALCISCNSKANKDRDWHEAWYTEIMRRRFI